MQVTDLIRKTGSDFDTSCKIYGVDTVFRSWESARRYALAHKVEILAKYEADCAEDERRNAEEWRAEAKVAIARALVRNGYSLPQAWDWLRDATDAMLGHLYSISKTAPAMLRID
jgi:hypothetical protein